MEEYALPATDITRAARLLIERRGPCAEQACQRLASARQAEGNGEAAAIWVQVGRELRALQNQEFGA